MQVTVTSDLHGILPRIEPTELVIICGDISPLRIQHNVPAMNKWFKGAFKNWVERLPCEQVIMTPGNHDYALAQMQSDTQRGDFERIFFCKSRNSEDVFYYKLKCLWNEFTEYNGLRIFGTPYCKIFGNWSFMCLPNDLAEKFEKINPNYDILITHDPVYNLGNTDTIIGEEGHFGNVQLRNRLEALHENCKGLPRYCFCGHFHSGDHSLGEWNGMKFANTSLVDESYEEAYDPLVLEI